MPSDLMNGFLVVDKPEGISSHGIVQKVRKVLDLKKAGHTGTLDPFATGVLPVALGEATKVIPFLDESVKEYHAVMRLGMTTDTQDSTGRVIRECEYRQVDDETVQEVFSRFVGEIEQVPPMFSALKRSGIPLYKLARRGEDVRREPRTIAIMSLVVEKIELPLVFFTVRCSRGTYVRTLANDMGDRIGCGAHLCSLRRTASGIFSLDDSIPLGKLESVKEEGDLARYVMQPLRCLGHLKHIPVTGKGAERIRCGAIPGNDGFVGLSGDDLPAGEKVCLTHGETLVAIAEVCGPDVTDELKQLRLLRVFNWGSS